MTNKKMYSTKGISYRLGVIMLAMATAAGCTALVGSNPNLTAGISVNAASTSQSTLSNPSFNLSNPQISTSFMTSNSNGYMRVYYNGKSVCVEYLNNSFKVTSRKTIAMELKIWGGFYEGKDAYYLVEGQENMNCKNGTEVIRIIKYSKSWTRLGAGKLYSKAGWTNPEIRKPFEWGNVSMTEKDGILYLATGREGYYDAAVGQGHQGLYMLSMNEKTFAISRVDSDLYHSLAQKIAVDGNSLYLFEQSEGDRCTTLTKYNTKTNKRDGEIIMLRYGGKRKDAWAVPCYSSVDDISVSKNNILGIGTSIDQSQYNNYKAGKTAYNIYLTITPRNNFSAKASKVRWLTNNKDNGKCYYGVKLTRINDNRFLLSWEENEKSESSVTYLNGRGSLARNTIHYMFIDGNGNTVSREFKQKGAFSDCHPIVKNGKAVFYASDNDNVAYYQIDGNTGAFSTVSNSSDTYAYYKSNTLYIAGTGCAGAEVMNDVFRSCYRVNSIVIEEGITGIKSGAVSGFRNATSISLPASLKTIGACAFENCRSIKSINIPKNTSSIDATAFKGCTSLSSINVNTGNNNYSSKNSVLYNKSQTKIILCPEKKSGSITIPGTVASIPGNVFSNRQCISKITIESGVSTIAANAFSNCKALTSITIPASVKSIGNGLFYSNSKVTIYGASGSQAEKYAAANKIKFVASLPSPLTNTSSLSANSVTLGNSITVKCAANGGDKNYTYQVYYRKVGASYWKTVKHITDYSKVMITPAETGSYEVQVTVKDGSNTYINKTMKFTVK